MYQAALLMVGSGIMAADIATKEDKWVFTLGGYHHAGRSRGEGFCIFNDVAVCAAYLHTHGIERIAIIDTDAHQGNGTMDIFYTNKNVLYISMHQDPRTLYPGRGFIHEIGRNEGWGYTINVPLPPYSNDEAVMRVLDEIVLPVVKEYVPQVIIRNGGSDPHYTDSLTHLNMSFNGFYTMMGKIRKLIGDLNTAYIDMMASGYGPLAVEGWVAHICGILDLPIPEELKVREEQYTRPSIKATPIEPTISAVRRELCKVWSCLR